MIKYYLSSNNEMCYDNFSSPSRELNGASEEERARGQTGQRARREKPKRQGCQVGEREQSVAPGIERRFGLVAAAWLAGRCF